MYKKYSKLMMVLCILFSNQCHEGAQKSSSERQQSSAINLDALTDIMMNGQRGFKWHHDTSICYAEIQNLEKDLNYAEIVKKFNCTTPLGQIYLLETLQHPLSPIDQKGVLQFRRNAIEALVKNPSMYQSIQTLLDEASVELMQVAQLVDRPLEYRFNEFTGKGEFKPKEESTDIVATTFFDALSFAWGIPSSALLLILPGWVAYRGWQYPGPITGIGIDNPGGFWGGAQAMVPAVIAAGYLAILSGPMRFFYKQACRQRNMIYALRRLFDIADRLETLCLKYNFDIQFYGSDCQKNRLSRKILDEMAHDRYRHESSHLFFISAVRVLGAEIRLHRDRLAPLFAMIAEIDALAMFARKIIESKDTANKFCVVDFIESERPEIQAKQFWNILVNTGVTQKIVANDLFEKRSIILTGPNEGGKTTSIRSILQNILLGQTFGVAAAEEFKFTPFNVIHSYLSIGDDILQGQSRFASEVRQAQDIIHRMQTLKSSEKFFFALDELFTGTNGKDGESCAYNFIDNIGSFVNVQFIYATHFDKLKTIQAENPLCSNYKVDAPVRNLAGKFVYPYTFSPGANTSYIALDRAREAGIFKPGV